MDSFSNNLKQKNTPKVNICGEAKEIIDKKQTSLAADFKNELSEVIEKYNIEPPDFYNYDHTGIMYRDLPNTKYTSHGSKNTLADKKATKDKEKLNIVVSVSIYGDMLYWYSFNVLCLVYKNISLYVVFPFH